MKIYKPNEHYFTGDTVHCVDVIDTIENDSQPLPFAGGKHRHSPDGFAWGYAGSGPAELARAILADHLGEPDPPAALYQDFKARVIAALPSDADDPSAIEWRLTSEDVDAYLAKYWHAQSEA